MPQNYLKGLKKKKNPHRFLGPMSISDSVGLGWDLEFTFLASSQVMLLLLFRGINLTPKTALNHSDENIKVIWPRKRKDGNISTFSSESLCFHNSRNFCSWKKLNIGPSYDPAIPLLGIYPEKTIIPKDTCTPMFITVLSTIAKTWKQPNCPSTEEWIKCDTYIQWNIIQL